MIPEYGEEQVCQCDCVSQTRGVAKPGVTVMLVHQARLSHLGIPLVSFCKMIEHSICSKCSIKVLFFQCL